MKFLILIFFVVHSLYSSIFDTLDFEKYKDSAGKVLFSSGLSEKQEQLEHLVSDVSALKTAERDEASRLQSEINQVNTQINELKTNLKTATPEEQELLNRKLSHENEIYQILFNIKLEQKQLLSNVDQHIKLLESYFKDPDFKTFVIERHTITTFKNLKDASEKVVSQEDIIKHLIEQKNELLVKLDNEKRKSSTILKEYQEKRKEQEAFGIKPLNEYNLSYKHQAELLDLEEKLLNFEKQLAELRVQESIRKIALLDSMISIDQEKLKVLKSNLIKEMSALRIEQTDIQSAREKLEKRKHESLATREGYYQTLKLYTAEREKLSKELEVLRKRYNITVADMRDLAEWNSNARTPEAYSMLCEVGNKYAYLTDLDNKIDYIRAQVDLETIKFRRDELSFDIMILWYKLTQRKFKSNDEVLAEIKRFKEIQAQILRDESSFKDKRNTATNALNIQNKALSNLKNIVQETQNQKDNLFKRYPQRYAACTEKLQDAEKHLAEQIDVAGKLIEIYSNIIATLESTSKDIVGIISELESN